jgi:fibronectin-binding autotransporter adhesin
MKSLARLVALSCLYSACGASLAQTVWQGGGGDSNWSTGANWVGGVAPASSATASILFGSSGGTNSLPVTDSAWTVNQLSLGLTSSSFLYRLTGSTITLNGTSPGIVFDTGSHLITNSLVLNADTTVNSATLFGGSSGLGGDISGTGGLTKTGAGILVLSGANSYASGTTVSSGTLEGDGTSSLQGNIVNNASVVFNPATDYTHAGSISGTGSITKSGAAQLTLTGPLAYTGTTTVSGGILAATLSSAAQLTVDDFSGTARFQSTGASTVGSIAGAPTGRIDLTGGSLTTGGDNANAIFNGVIYNDAGVMTLTKNGSGTQTVMALSYTPGFAPGITGVLNVNGGTLQIGDGTNGAIASGNYQVVLANNSTVNFDVKNGDTWTIADLSGTGGLVKSGAGSLTVNPLGVPSTISGPIAVNGGFMDAYVNSASGLTIASGATFRADGGPLHNSVGSLSGGGTLDLQINHLEVGGGNASSTFGGDFVGNRKLYKLGSGTLTLNGTSNVNGALIEVSAGTLAIGDGSAVMTGGYGIVNNGALVYDLPAASTVIGGVSGTGSVTKSGAGTVVLTDVSYTGATTINGGTLQIGDGSNGILNSIGFFGNPILGTSGIVNNGTLDFRLQSLVGYDSILVNANISGSGDLTVSGGNTVGVNLNGANTYTGTTTVSAGSLRAQLNNNARLQVDSAGTYTSALPFPRLNNDPSKVGSLSGAGTVVTEYSLDVGGDNTSTLFNGTIRNFAQGFGLIKNGSGTFTLGGSGANIIDLTAPPFSGNPSTIVINAGALQIGDGGLFQSLHISGIANNTSNPLVLNINQDLFLCGSCGIDSLTGSGGVTLNGSGTIRIGDNANTGPTVVNSGTLGGYIHNGAALTLGAGATFAALAGTGGSVSSIGSLAGTATSGIDLSQGGLSIGADNSSSTFAGSIVGASIFRQLVKTGSGTLTLTGTNTYSGGTLVSAGTLQGDTNSLQGFITNNAAVTFNQAGPGTYSGNMDGSGSVTKTGAGTLILGGFNTYSGGTTVAAGTLQGDTTSLQGNITNNAAVTFDQAAPGTYAGNMSGSGSLTKIGADILILSGTNTYGGGTTVGAGTLQGDSTGLQGNITNNAAVTFDQSGSGTYAGNMDGTGNLAKTGAGTLILGGTNSYTGGTTVSAGTLQGDSASLQGAIINNAAVTFNQAAAGTYAGNMSGTGSLAKTGAGTLVLGSTNSYSGGTAVSAGTLQGDTASLQGNITNNAAITFNQAANGTYAGIMSGTGNLTKTGAGTLTLGGTNSYTGGTTVSAGTLQGDTASLQGNITNNGAVAFNQVANGTYAGSMAGTGSLTKSGAGTLILGGTNSYTGGTTVGAGTLQGDTTSLQGNIGNNATVTFNQAALGSYAGNMAGVGGLIKNGAGDLKLTGSSTYSGATQINAGILSVNGSIASPVTVNAAATLGGSGTINNTVAILAGGTFAPGNSIGTITVNGAVTFNAGSIFRVEASAAGTADRINVIGAPGTATLLGGTVDVQAGAGTYNAATAYTILNATGGVAGTFAGVTSNLAFLAPALSYDPNNVFLTLTRNTVTLPSVALTPNQLAVSTMLQGVANTNPTGDMGTIVNAIVGSSAPQARATYDALGGATYVELFRANQTFALGYNRELDRRLTSPEISRTSLMRSDDAAARDGRGFWLDIVGSRGQTDGDGNAYGSSLRSSGLSLGADAAFGEDGVLGVSAASRSSDLKFDSIADTGSVRSNALGFYGRQRFGDWSVKAIANAARQTSSMRRVIGIGGSNRVASGNIHGSSATGYVEVRRDLAAGAITFQPLAGLTWAYTRLGSFTETGADAANLDLSSQTAHSARSAIGLGATYAVATDSGGTIKIEPRLVWQHEYADLNAPLAARLTGAGAIGNFSVFGATLKRDSIDVALGISGAIRKDVSLALDTQWVGNGRESAYGIFGGVRVAW